MAARAVERLLNVIMTIGSRRRMDRTKLFAVIPDYANAASPQAAERMFERDKASILDLGLPLVSERDVLDENTVYYRIDAAESDAVLDLSAEEYTVLLAASRAWDETAGGAARRVRSKLLSLGHDADPDLLRRTPRGAIESLPVLSPLLEAVTSARAVRFTYRSTDAVPAQRRVEPWVVGAHDGHWYVHGWDLDREAPRLFRASRIESFPALGTAATHPRPPQVDLEDVLGRLDASEDRARARVRAAPFKALALRDRAGAALDDEEFDLPELPRPAARRLVLGSVRWLELLAPAPWRAELVEVLATIRDAHAGEAETSVIERASPRGPLRIRSAATGADQLSRLIAEASFVMERGEVALAELAEALGVDEQQLVSDLQVLFLCGDLGTGWEDLIEVEWEHGVVRVRNADPLHRALRLSPVEITALLAGLAALEPSAGETGRIVDSARAKLRSAAAAQGTQAPEPGDAAGSAGGATAMASRTADRATTVLHAVQEALRSEEHAAVTIRYSSPGGPGTSVRRIRPRQITSDGARSYLVADCELAGAERLFRLDRIVEILPSDAEQHRAGQSAGPDLRGIVDAPGQQGVWLRLDPPARWIAESFDAAELRDAEGGVVLARLDRPVRAALVDAVLEAAGHAEVIAPRDLRDTIVTVTRTAGSLHAVTEAIP